MGASQVVLVVRNTHANAEDVRDRGLMAESGRSPREGNGCLLQYSCLENPMDRGAWQVTVHGVRSSLVSSFCCTARSSVMSSSFRSSSSLYTKHNFLWRMYIKDNVCQARGLTYVTGCANARSYFWKFIIWRWARGVLLYWIWPNLYQSYPALYQPYISDFQMF